jgi:hypothetical protein
MCQLASSCCPCCWPSSSSADEPGSSRAASSSSSTCVIHHNTRHPCVSPRHAADSSLSRHASDGSAIVSRHASDAHTSIRERQTRCSTGAALTLHNTTACACFAYRPLVESCHVAPGQTTKEVSTTTSTTIATTRTTAASASRLSATTHRAAQSNGTQSARDACQQYV